jgi:prevent-host-death family protein
MKIIPIAEAKAKLSEYIDKSDKEAVIITKNGRPRAMIVPIDNEDEDLEMFALTHSKKFREIWRRSEKSLAEGRGLSKDQLLAAVEKKLTKKK